MNILIGKYFKKSWIISEDDNTQYDKTYRNFGGQDALAKMWLYLAEAYPEHTFYLCSNNNLDKTNINLPNLVNLSKLINDYVKEHKDTCAKINEDVNNGKLAYYKVAEKYVKEVLGIRFDISIICHDSMNYTCLYAEGFTKVYNPEVPYKLRNRDKGGSVIVNLSNKLADKVYMFGDDSRILSKINRELFHIDKYFSQVNCSVMRKTIKLDENGKTVRGEDTVNIYYKELEKIFLAEKTKIDFTNPDNIVVNGNSYSKSRDFIMTLHGTDDRYEMLKQWVFPFKPQQKIYGIWTGTPDFGKPLCEEIYTGPYKDNFEQKAIIDMEDEMWETKYTFVPLINKNWPNFVTQKVWAMMYYGIIPFYPKGQYDSDNIYHYLPDYIKVETPEELWQKIDELNNNKEKYINLLKELYSLLEDKYFNSVSNIKGIFDEILM